MAKFFGFDIGGSSIKAAPVNTSDGALLSPVESLALPEPTTPTAVLSAIQDHLKRNDWRKGFGVGFPGVVDRGRTITACHMGSGWEDLNLFDQLQSLTTGSVALLNDADAAGLAEMQFGAGRDLNNPEGGSVLMVTFGTGIGTAIFHGGVLYPNTEFGHSELNGADAEKTASARVRTRLDLDWPEWAERVNLFLVEMEKLLSPDRIIIGGGVSENFPRFQPYLKARADLRPAQLANCAGLVGAALAASRV